MTAAWNFSHSSFLMLTMLPENVILWWKQMINIVPPVLSCILDIWWDEKET